MYRFVETKLVEWLNRRDRKPLIVRGARQVGKTWSILQFGKKIFPGKIYYVDLEKNYNFHKFFEPDLEPKRIISDLEIALNTRIIPGEGLLFLDEIQSCPRALMSLRYFYEELPDLHIIAAGSLLEFALKDISFPVGRVQFLEMRPMSFLEFLLALGNEKAVEVILDESIEIPETTHLLLLDLLRRYFFVGGMPECVKTYVETQKLSEVFEVQRNLIESFREDFSKYSIQVDKHCLNAVLVNAARSVGNQIVFSRLSDGFTSPTNKKAFVVLSNARLLQPIYPVKSPELPLGAFVSNKKVKSIFVDVGLLQYVSGVQVNEEYYKEDLLGIYNGRLAEQFVGQELLANGVNELYYWAREAKSSTAEIDYIFDLERKIIPIEVKSGPAGRLKSLHLFLRKYPRIENAYVLSSAPFGYLPEQKLNFIPLYAISRFFKKNIKKN
ncbi:MAG: ATP-binding protein [Calditrichia bacterium]